MAASSLAPYPALDREKRHSSHPQAMRREHWKNTVNQRASSEGAAGLAFDDAKNDPSQRHERPQNQGAHFTAGILPYRREKQCNR